MDAPEPRPVQQRVCVLVASSDNTADVFRQVAPGFQRHWPDCPLPRFVGLNEDAAPAVGSGFTPVLCAEALGWRGELARQVAALPPQFDHVLLFLDDFLILRRVDTPALLQLIELALARELAYLRLIPELHSLAESAWLALGPDHRSRPVSALAADTPYYSSLQLVLWRRSHLADLLAAPGSIWDFELQRPAATHHAITVAPPVSYRHVVERGLWMRDAPWLFRRSGLPFEPGDRPLAPWPQLVRHGWRRLKFAAIGYAWYRRRLARQAAR